MTQETDTLLSTEIDISAQISRGLDSMAAYVSQQLEDLGENLPQINLYMRGLYRMAITLAVTAFHAQAGSSVSVTTNVFTSLDGVSSVLMGLGQLLDQRDPDEYITKSKALINISSGATTLTIMALAAPALPFALAAATTVDCLLSFHPLTVAAYKYHSPLYWVEHSLAQLDKLEGLVEKMQREIDELNQECQQPSHHRSKPVLQWALKQKEASLSQLHEECFCLKKDILYQVAYHAQQHPHDASFLPQMASILQQDRQHTACADFQTLAKNLVETNGENESQPKDHFIQALSTLAKTPSQQRLVAQECRCLNGDFSSHLSEQHHVIQQKAQQQLWEKAETTVFLAVVAAGSIMLCIPPVAPVGLLFLGAAAGYYLAKQGYVHSPTLSHYFASKVDKASTLQAAATSAAPTNAAPQPSPKPPCTSSPVAESSTASEPALYQKLNQWLYPVVGAAAALTAAIPTLATLAKLTATVLKSSVA